MGEIIFGTTLIGSLVGWTFIVKDKLPKWLWFTTMMGCCLWVIGMEVFSKISNGHSISQLYWSWSLANEGLSWLVSALMLGGWINLIVHLQWKVIKRRFFK